MSEPNKNLDHVIAVGFGIYQSHRENFLELLETDVKHDITGRYTDEELEFVAALVNEIIATGKIESLANDPSGVITGPECLKCLQQIKKNPDPKLFYAAVPQEAWLQCRLWGIEKLLNDMIYELVAKKNLINKSVKEWIQRTPPSEKQYQEPTAIYAWIDQIL
ncbi:hypothetical protein HYFRA_00012906 [Hymenoscyphus fraxineus]|uniref:Uncharacterized protein n=1 Tax=Hymenoscyphus fraxineus TaxID=746836 RepID=A0A9N9PLW1_9HELO|nr:hypothetical protein HYFRA_00012906 [Hymenoscyphus fraxineus]